MTGDDDNDPAEEELTPTGKRRRTPAPKAHADAPADDFDIARAIKGDYAGDALFLARRSKSDLGNAERFIARHGADVIWTEELRWLVWDGARFRHAGGEPGALRLAQRTVKRMPEELHALRAARPVRHDDESAAAFDARVEAHEAAVAALTKFCTTSGNYDRTNKILKHAAPLLRAPASTLDGHPYLLACPNGTLDLSGPCAALLPADRTHRLTKSAAAPYDPNADQTPVRAFLERIVPDAAVRHYLHKLLGYCLSGDRREQIAVFLYGEGSNGKSSLLEMIRGALGDLAMQAPFSILVPVQRTQNQASPDLARLAGCRLLTVTEPRSDEALDESIIKAMTGGEPMTVRALYGVPFEFHPTHCVVVAMNPKPVVRASDHGTWRRLRLVHFTELLGAQEGDNVLRAHALAPETRPAVLAWLVDGYELYRAEGLDPPAAVTAETAAWKAETNPVPDFLNAGVFLYAEPDDTSHDWRVQAGTAYGLYLLWAGESGVAKMSPRRFGEAMAREGIRKVKASSIFYEGLKAAPEWLDKLTAAKARSGNSMP